MFPRKKWGAFFSKEKSGIFLLNSNLFPEKMSGTFTEKNPKFFIEPECFP
jgi:hypothetical protein